VFTPRTAITARETIATELFRSYFFGHYLGTDLADVALFKSGTMQQGD
jgi:hypothetical protein